MQQAPMQQAPMQTRILRCVTAHSDTPPDTYREFLARTHGLLLHEPSACAAPAGRGVG